MNGILFFIYHRKLRMVTGLAVREGKSGRPLLVAETRKGDVKSFYMDEIVPLTKEMQDVIDGEVEIETDEYEQ